MQYILTRFICSDFLQYFVLLCNNMISVEKEDICNFDGRVIEVEKLLKNNC